MTKSIDDLLRETLHGRGAETPPTPCLDAETVAAFADDTLTRQERAVAEAHVAHCSRCQAVLAAVVKAEPQPLARPWWRVSAVRWLVPLATAAVAVTIWVNLPSRAERQAPPSVQAAATRDTVATPVPPPAAQPPSAPLEAAREAYRSNPTPAPPVSSARTASAGEVRLKPDTTETGATAVKKPDTTETEATAVKKPDSTAPRLRDEERESAAFRKALPASPLPSTLTDSLTAIPPPTAPARPNPSLAEAGANRTAPAATEPRADAPPPTAEERVTVRSADRVMARTFDGARSRAIVSSNPISRWRIVDGGAVEHSADGGVTWRTQPTGLTMTLTAGASPSPAVCWLVGPRGVVVVSTDEGRSWQRLAFPETIDLVSVHAIDDKTATVTTSDGRRFSTANRGVTWMP